MTTIQKRAKDISEMLENFSKIKIDNLNGTANKQKYQQYVTKIFKKFTEIITRAEIPVNAVLPALQTLVSIVAKTKYEIRPKGSNQQSSQQIYDDLIKDIQDYIKSSNQIHEIGTTAPSIALLTVGNVSNNSNNTTSINELKTKLETFLHVSNSSTASVGEIITSVINSTSTPSSNGQDRSVLLNALMKLSSMSTKSRTDGNDTRIHETVTQYYAGRFIKSVEACNPSFSQGSSATTTINTVNDLSSDVSGDGNTIIGSENQQKLLRIINNAVTYRTAAVRST